MHPKSVSPDDKAKNCNRSEIVNQCGCETSLCATRNVGSLGLVQAGPVMRFIGASRDDHPGLLGQGERREQLTASTVPVSCLRAASGGSGASST